MIDILYDDKDFLICEKKPGMASEMSDSGDSLPRLLEEQLGCRIFTVHRLDKPVGGVMVYGKTQKGAAALTRAIGENKLKKTYLAVLDGVPEIESATLTDLLFRDSRKNKTYAVKRMRKGVKEAILSYETLAAREEHALVKVSLVTGRTHQIRAQFASRGLPLTGDGKYGSRCNKCTAALWSYSLSLPHPVTGEMLSFTAQPFWENFPWTLFKTEDEM